MLKTIVAAALALPIAAFFAFVGWHKTFSPVAELAKHGAFTVHFPEYLGRLVGVTEMLCALALLVGIVPRWRSAAKWSAVTLFGNQIIAGTVHIIHGETHSLPGNGLWMAMTAALFAVCVWRPRAESDFEFQQGENV